MWGWDNFSKDIQSKRLLTPIKKSRPPSRDLFTCRSFLSQLNGAVIASTATADRNKLDTGTLGFSDIKNSAEYKVEHQSVGISSGGGVADGGVLGDVGKSLVSNLATGLLVGVNNSGSASSMTKAAMSEGTIIVRDKDKQTQDVSQLSRDVKNANPGLSPIFDKEKEQQRLQEAQLIGEIGAQASDIARTQGDLEGLKKAKEKYPNLSADELRKTDVYQTEMQQWGTGSAIQQGIQAATAVVQGLAGGNIAKVIAGGSAPYLAEVIHNMTTNPKTDQVNTEANLMAHAVLGAVVAQINGNSALAGAAGATTGEYIAQQLYPGVPREKLTEDQRQTISALATLAAGLAGGVIGDSTADAVAGAQAGKNSSNNNNLSLPGGMGSYGQAASSLGSSMIEAGAITDEINAALSKNAKGDLPEGANITKAIVDGYKDGVLIAGAGYLGPAASIGKIVGGAAIAEIANGTYQWFDINSEKNQSLPEYQQKTWDYKGSAGAAISGALAPGRTIIPNVGIAIGGSIFTDGPDAGSVSGAVAGTVAAGAFGKYVPAGIEKITGSNNIPDFIYDVIGSGGSEVIGGFVKDGLSSGEQNSKEKK